MGKTKPRKVSKGRITQRPTGASANGNRAKANLSAKNRRLIKTLQSWLADESGYDEETWPWLKKALEEDRLSARRLFRE